MAASVRAHPGASGVAACWEPQDKSHVRVTHGGHAAIQDDSKFPAADLSGEAEAEVFAQLLLEIRHRIPVFGPLHESGELTNRGKSLSVLASPPPVSCRVAGSLAGARTPGPHPGHWLPASGESQSSSAPCSWLRPAWLRV